MLNDEQEKAEREWIEKWWADRAGPLRWRDLTDKGSVILAAWFVFSESNPPSKREDLPVECLDIIQGLARVTKTYPERYKFVQATNPLERAYYDGQPGLLHGKRRQVKVRKKRSQLAT